MKEITQQWLDYAKADLLNCELISDEVFLTNIVAFHSQQTIEKCFKAIVEEKGLKIERVHNLFKLYTFIETRLTFEVDLNLVELLDKVYTSSRYPGDVGLMPYGKPTQREAKKMYEFAKCVFSNTVEMLTTKI
jgi:HEPN domain-containing protein